MRYSRYRNKAIVNVGLRVRVGVTVTVLSNQEPYWDSDGNAQSSPWDMWISPKLFLDQLNA